MSGLGGWRSNANIRAREDDGYFMLKVLFPPSFINVAERTSIRWLPVEDDQGNPLPQAEDADFIVTYEPLASEDGSTASEQAGVPVRSIWQCTEESTGFLMVSQTENFSSRQQNSLGSAVFDALDKDTVRTLRKIVASDPTEGVDERLESSRRAWEAVAFPQGDDENSSVFFRDVDHDVRLSIPQLCSWLHERHSDPALADIVRQQMSEAELTQLGEEVLRGLRTNIVFSLGAFPAEFCLAEAKTNVLSSLYDDMCTHASLGGGLKAASRIRENVMPEPEHLRPHNRHPENFAKFCETHHLGYAENHTEEAFHTVDYRRAVSLVLKQTSPGWTMPDEYTQALSSTISTDD